tara:strand:+ start:1465 stop:1662 length:198 start_codon:yes stop_codon:yes gene_type:complete
MSKKTIWSGDIIKDFNEKIQKERNEVKRLREKLAEVEYRLEMAEDVLGRSDWNTIYREIIDEVIE